MEQDELVRTACRVARIEGGESALRWLRATLGILSDWGGSDARRALREVFPSSLLRGAGARGRSYAAVVRSAPDGSEGVRLVLEAARRVREPDPGKVGVTLPPLVGLIKERLGAGRSEQVAAALPPEVAADFRAASAASPWTYGLIAQSYARPSLQRPNIAGELGSGTRTAAGQDVEATGSPSSGPNPADEPALADPDPR